ncbi:MAG: hypothetical protein IIT86_12600 [Oscillospiraceae bacterium]|nr:hypothetical protein [Oscillospiraceae bacterium]
MRDGRDDVFDSGGGLKKTVTIVTTVTESFGGDAREPFSKGAPCRGAIRR